MTTSQVVPDHVPGSHPLQLAVAVSRALDQAIGDRTAEPILLNTRRAWMDRHAATRRLRALAQATGMRLPPLHYDRARNHLDRHPNYILAAYMASGT
jgi:hypothetical protein